MIIIMRFGENNVLCPKYIDIYVYIWIWISGGTGDKYMVHGTFFVYYKKNTEKVQEHDLYLNQILHHFDFFF